MERRAFLVAVGGVATTAVSARRVRGANDRLGVAVVGSGRRGRQVMKKMLETGRVELRALCDVYDEQRRRAREELLGPGTSVYETTALEDVLARRDVDAVLLATPDHLHQGYAIAVLRSGRHLYLEKPSTLRWSDPPTRAPGESGEPFFVHRSTKSWLPDLLQRAGGRLPERGMIVRAETGENSCGLDGAHPPQRLARGDPDG